MIGLQNLQGGTHRATDGQLSTEERVGPETLAAEAHPGQETAVHLGRLRASISSALRRDREFEFEGLPRDGFREPGCYRSSIESGRQ